MPNLTRTSDLMKDSLTEQDFTVYLACEYIRPSSVSRIQREQLSSSQVCRMYQLFYRPDFAVQSCKSGSMEIARDSVQEELILIAH
jgi:hypothetical protein